MSKKSINAQVIMFDSESNEVLVQRVLEANADMVETENGIFHTASAKTYVDTRKGSLVYVFDADLPARVEAESLKLLRRNAAIKNIFSFERGTGSIDWFKWLPWIVIMMLILFHK